MPVIRKEKLLQWLASHFGQPVTAALICGDASFRRYYRVKCGHLSFIVMDTPVALIATEPFVEVAAAYAMADIPVPEIIAVEPQQGFILLQDLGDISLLSRLDNDTVEPWYHAALALLPQVAKVRATTQGALPQYDAEFVMRELAIFSEWLLQHHLGMRLTEPQQTMLAAAFSVLCDSALAQPQVGMHRDFHSRNLMVHDEKLYVIDFQDAVVGPMTYDAVSLIRDCYIRWPDAVVERLQVAHFDLCRQQGLLADNHDLAEYIQWFDLMGIQRHLKAAGIFARLYHRDQKPGYLKDIPLTLSYIVDVAARYPALQPLAAFVGEIQPLVAAKDGQ
nr:phosphotransferase [Shewanella sp. NIFS-20-20]